MGDTTATLERLRRAFDESFAAPRRTTAADLERLLFARVSGETVAMRTRDLAAVSRCPPLTAAPSTHPALLGLASVRGSIVAVYHLGVLLGRDPDRNAIGWIAPWPKDRTVALWFEEIVGFERLDRPPTSAEVRVVDQHGTPRLLLDVSSMLQAMLSHATPPGAEDGKP